MNYEMLETIDIQEDLAEELSQQAVHATGFAVPGAEESKPGLSLDQLLIHDHSATFFMRLESSEWKEEGIFPGDLLVVDTAATPQPGQFIVGENSSERVLRKAIRKTEHERTPYRIRHSKEAMTYIQSNGAGEAALQTVFGVVIAVVRKY